MGVRPALSVPPAITLAAPLASRPPVPMVSVSPKVFIVAVETALILKELIVRAVTAPTLAAMVMLSVARPAVSRLAE